MENRKLYLVIVTILLVIFIIGMFPYALVWRMVVCDVGQGQAVLLSRGRMQILIDAGPNGDWLLQCLDENIGLGDKKIEMIILSHFDQDHIVGVLELLEVYAIDKVLVTLKQPETEISAYVYQQLQGSTRLLQEGREGLVLGLPSAELSILWPLNDGTVLDSNDSSMVVQFISNGHKILVLGDVDAWVLQELENRVPSVNYDFVVLSHHGSRNGLYPSFYTQDNVSAAIISSGAYNSYRHPHQVVLNHMQKQGIAVYRTDLHGSLKFDLQVD